MGYEGNCFRCSDRAIYDFFNQLVGEYMMLYKCVWFTPLINFREATRGRGRTDRKVGGTGLTFDQIKDKWRSICVAVAAEAKKSGVVYPLEGDLRAQIRINPDYVPKFKNENVVQYAKYPLDALTKAGIYQDDSQIVDATYNADFSLRGSVEVSLWQK